MPSGNSNEDTTVQKTKHLKRRLNGSGNDPRKDTRMSVGDELRPKRANRGIMAQAPLGFATGDRVFVRHNGEEIYSDIAGGKYGAWLSVGTNGVEWGEGEGAVWIHIKRPGVDEVPWEVLKMEPVRMEKLYMRNLTRLMRRQPTVLLPEEFQKLFHDREMVRVAKEKTGSVAACKALANEKLNAELDKVREQAADLQTEAERRRQDELLSKREVKAKRLRVEKKSVAEAERHRVVTDQMKEKVNSELSKMRKQMSDLQEQAEKSKQEMLRRHRMETAKVLHEKQNAVDEAERHRIVREEALAKAKSKEEEKFIALLHAKKEKDDFEHQRDQLLASFTRRENELREAQSYISELSQRSGGHHMTDEERRLLKERHDRTFRVEKDVDDPIDLDLGNDLPCHYDTLTWHVENTESWAGADDTGYNSSWLGSAYQQLLEYRGRTKEHPDL